MALSKLGRSFSELIEQNREESIQEFKEIPIKSISKNPQQPRTTFDDSLIEQLSQSIQTHGLLQPVVVMPKEGGYELVAGERRLRAIESLGWEKIPVRILKLDESSSLQVALVENIQRENLNPIECALAYRELITRFGLTQQQLSRQLGKDRSTIANTLRLLELPQSVQKMLENKQLSMGHARALLALKTPAEIEALAARVVKDTLSVREVEDLLRPSVPSSKRSSKPQDPNIKEIESDLSRALGTRVMVRQGQKKGRIIIEYYSLDDFDRIRQQFSKS